MEIKITDVLIALLPIAISELWSILKIAVTIAIAVLLIKKLTHKP